MVEIRYYTLSEPLDQSLVGMKGANLAKLFQMGFNVPEAICLPVYQYHSENRLHPSVIETLPKLLDQVLSSSMGWAVRSSSTMEDSRTSSKAGQFKTVIISQPFEVVDAICEVISSGELGPNGEHGMGVIIQKFIEPDFAGVVFSRNPLTGVAEPVVEICKGRGEQLVSGSVDPWVYSGTGWETESLVDFNQQILDEILSASLSLAKTFGYDVDLEWAVKDNVLYWLQVRPITVIECENDRFLHEISQLKGDWFLMDQCDQPFVPLIEDLDPSGYLNQPFWEMKFIFHYPYIQMKEMNPGQMKPRTFKDVWNEWKTMDEKYHTVFTAALTTNLSEVSNTELWDVFVQRVENNRRFAGQYLDRSWFFYRRMVAGKIQERLKKTCACPQEMLSYMSILISSLDTMTLQKQKALRKLVELVRTKSDFESDPDFLKGFSEFIEEYGYEAPNPIYYYLPTLAEKPERLLNIVKNLSWNPEKNIEVNSHATWRRGALTLGSKMEEKERFSFYRLVLILRKLLLRTENDDYLLQKAVNQVRHVIMEMGRRLLPARSQDVFFLRSDELRDWLVNNVAQSSKEIDRRKIEFEQAKKICPPENIANSKPVQEDLNQRAPNTLKGQPACFGVAEGPVYIVKDPLHPDRFTDIPEGAVVVSRLLTPALAGHLVSAKAFIIEAGSFLSHGAILAREMQIPALIGVKGAVSSLSDGDYVKVDVYQGVVNKN